MVGKISEEFANVSVQRITTAEDFDKSETVESIKDSIRKNPGTSIHGSLPCTPWCTWQNVAVKRNGPEYATKLKRRRDKSKKMVQDFIDCGDLCLSLGGEVSFEWPRTCTGWMLPKLNIFIKKHSLFLVDVDGCSCGMTNSSGEPVARGTRSPFGPCALCHGSA